MAGELWEVEMPGFGSGEVSSGPSPSKEQSSGRDVGSLSEEPQGVPSTYQHPMPWISSAPGSGTQTWLSSMVNLTKTP